MNNCSTKVKENATSVDKQEVSSTSTSLDSCTPQIHETAIVYLDDLEVEKKMVAVRIM